MLSNKSLSILFFGALAWLLLLGSQTDALPTGASTLGTPSANFVSARAPQPDVPKSKADLEKNYYKSGPPKDKSCFFTGMDVNNGKKPKQNTNEAKKQCKDVGLTTLDQIWNKNNIVQRGEWNKPTNDQYNDLIVWISEIFAEKTSGHAYLLIDKDTKPKDNSIFYSNEFKAMKDGDKVDKIMQVDFKYGEKPTLPDASKDDHVWWKKGAADPPHRPADKQCTKTPSEDECL